MSPILARKLTVPLYNVAPSVWKPKASATWSERPAFADAPAVTELTVRTANAFALVQPFP